MTTQKKGFTLVELSIVLVIIGLLIGGVLKGQSMIQNAKVKRFASDVDGLVAATYGYQDKLNVLPGDTSGDGLIGTLAEQIAFYQNIISEGFISGDSTKTTLATLAKTTPFGSQYTVLSVTGYGEPHTAAENAIQTTSAIVPPDIAGSLDTKYDDGVYNKGDFQASADYNGTANVTVTWFKF